MNLVWTWLTDPDNWHKSINGRGIPYHVLKHLEYTGLATAFRQTAASSLLAAPLGPARRPRPKRG